MPIVQEKLTGAVHGALEPSTSVSGLEVVILHCSSTSSSSDGSLRVGTEADPTDATSGFEPWIRANEVEL